jgi:hypothetical protein
MAAVPQSSMMGFEWNPTGPNHRAACSSRIRHNRVRLAAGQRRAIVEQVLCALYGDRARMPERASARSYSDHHDVLPIDATHCNHVLPPGRDGEDGSRRPVRRRRRPQGCGIDNLRIADASIMPRITSRNIVTPCAVIGERAAQMLISDQSSDLRQPSA